MSDLDIIDDSLNKISELENSKSELIHLKLLIYSTITNIYHNCADNDTSKDINGRYKRITTTIFLVICLTSILCLSFNKLASNNLAHISLYCSLMLIILCFSIYHFHKYKMKKKFMKSSTYAINTLIKAYSVNHKLYNDDIYKSVVDPCTTYYKGLIKYI